MITQKHIEPIGVAHKVKPKLATRKIIAPL